MRKSFFLIKPKFFCTDKFAEIKLYVYWEYCQQQIKILNVFFPKADSHVNAQKVHSPYQYNFNCIGQD